MSLQADCIVVGSGFGGSIAAARVAQAGKSVIVLERGQRWTHGQFPRNVRDVENLFWRYPHDGRWRGLYDLRAFSGLAALVASGVGGGSLIYANIHIRPDASVFDDPRWPSEFTRAGLDTYYDRVAKRLGVAPVPSAIDLPKRTAFQQAGTALGKEVFDPEQAVRWSGPEENGRKACELAAECEFGCQRGAKNTLDLTYLADAEQAGAQVRPLSMAEYVEPEPGGGYRVHFVDIETGVRDFAVGQRVVLAAGTLGTTELLFKSRDSARTLPNVSARLGTGYSANGDFLGSVQNTRDDLDPARGPDVTSVMKFFDQAPGFTMAAPTFNSPVMAVLASFGQPEGAMLQMLAPTWPLLLETTVTAFRSGLLSQPIGLPMPHAGNPRHMTNLFAIGRDNANGQMRMHHDKLDIAWDYATENEGLITRMEAAMRDVAGVYGGTFAPLIQWAAFKKILTVHSLGGCHLSKDPAGGVVATNGEVHGYPGLFVADGSVIPTSIGFHPSMTIAAVSERIADAVAASY